ncbi:MAG: hypothetical protein A3H70_02925 [Candidatus Komeilibacteria bacterium RIFCSPLOWO2_02_FULL_48_11]|uniref:Polymerase beta nucleotidyltransferase domain-containing protein n=1 Tax=Candidatus Komeilibacteria bacterium RIFCSPLOWO2_02_FULL_48_11 TaxID=1798553 RepID=A0A1G2BTR2_9BACT|nr:MAG: hypothetical protein A3H70_02925 [Candidatus Komeilibacteria bacterium RIFCSPLOWO2_02_FULL_48_11]
MKGINLIILFGSQATGQTRPGSDVDVAVLADHVLSLQEKSDIGQELSLELKVSDDIIDIIDLQTASPLLQQQISTHGKLLRGSKDDFIRWRVLAWKIYQDTAKFRRAREQALIKQAHV